MDSRTTAPADLLLLNDDSLHQVLTDALEVSLGPYVSRLEFRLEAVEDRIAAHVPRRNITRTTKHRHQKVIAALGNRCPCCGVNVVLDDERCVIDAEFDHFYSRERREFSETWLICQECHLDMRDRSFFIVEFQAYQKRATSIENGQLELMID